MKAVGEDKWAAAASDSTNTTLAARREITKAIPTVINLCDVVHHLQHVIGDITELPEFVVVRFLYRCSRQNSILCPRCYLI